jgi:hypothetical protein
MMRDGGRGWKVRPAGTQVPSNVIDPSEDPVITTDPLTHDQYSVAVAAPIEFPGVAIM